MGDISDVAQALFASGKGLLANDETIPHADRFLASYGIATGEEMRRKYRDLLLSTPGLEDYVSGVILFEETLGQKDSKDGRPSKEVDNLLFPELLSKRGIIPGIKVDEGLEPFPESPDESLTRGMLGLSERLTAFQSTYGTGFTKWRAAIKIEGDRLPTARAIVENAKRLAYYACESQRAHMLPILEPEVLFDGTHNRLRAKEVVEQALGTVMHELVEQCADPSLVVIKTSMVLSGKDSGRIDSPEEVAEATVSALMNVLRPEIAGVVFLSGGQTPDAATANLAAVHALAKKQNAPWPLTFSFARALQEDALDVWRGKDENIPAAQEAFLKRLKKVSDAVS